MATEMNELLANIHLQNVEGAHFYSEKTFLDGFNEKIFNKVLDEISSDESEITKNDEITRKSYRQTIFDTRRICLGILTSIGRQRYIFRFCEDDRLRDDRLPTTMDILEKFQLKNEDANFVTVFYQKQFVFKPYTFSRFTSNAQLQDLEPEIIIPVMRKTKHAEGGWSVVYKIEIHPDYDNLGYGSCAGGNAHVYACKQLIEEDGTSIDDEEPGHAAFREEVFIQFALQKRSEHILPLLTAYKHHNTYQMVFPLADYDLRTYIQRSDAPNDPEERLEFMQKLRHIISAIRTIHEYATGESSNKSNDSSMQAKTIGNHRDISPQNILFMGGQMLLADFGHAKIKEVKPGDDSGSPWRWASSTYSAPECSNTSRVVGRGGDIWSLACIMSEMLTFDLMGRKGVEEYAEARNIDNRDIFHHKGYIKGEVLTWFGTLKQRSNHSKFVVEVLALLQDMLNDVPKDRPDITTVDTRFSNALANWDTQIIRDGNATLTAEAEKATEIDQEVLEKSKPRTSDSRIPNLRKLFVPFDKINIWSFFPRYNSSASKTPIQHPNDEERPYNPRSHTEPEVSTVVQRSIFGVSASSVTGDSRPQYTLQHSQTDPVGGEIGKREDYIAQPPTTDISDSVLRKLKYYDTVFLVDDSKIDEKKWVLLGQVLVNLASVAVELDPDGIDLRFVDAEHRDIDDVKRWVDVAEAFSSVHPTNSRLHLDDPVRDILQPYLDAQRREKNPKAKRKDGYKSQLNLIILTDGEVDKMDDIERVVMDAVQELNASRANPRSIGIQFVVIGATEPDSYGSQLLERLDDKIADNPICNGRDIVDKTIFDESLLNDRATFKKMLCGAINSKLDNSDCPSNETSYSWSSRGSVAGSVASSAIGPRGSLDLSPYEMPQRLPLNLRQ
ncbi:kinase-like domain-containing protein [Pyronema omphalodes]|nr:kinase-like domain-containing protein [Pyronema omphalodes]